jgi:(R,R)-butanediol dehydrogenase/meso-butanediol dehydrogenase/diacetyl reductase
MVEKGKLPVERIVTGRIAADDVVDKGFRTLLDPSGDQMKVMVSVA